MSDPALRNDMTMTLRRYLSELGGPAVKSTEIARSMFLPPSRMARIRNSIWRKLMHRLGSADLCPHDHPNPLWGEKA